MKKGEKQASSSMEKPRKINAVTIRFTQEEYEKFEKLMSIRWIQKSTLARRLFTQRFPEFLKKNQFGVYVPYENSDNSYTKSLQFYIDAETTAQLEKLITCTGLTKLTVARMVIIPALQEEIENIKEIK